MIKSIEFTKDKSVLVDGRRYGQLTFDKQNKYWVLWTGISFTDSNLQRELFGTILSDEVIGYDEDLIKTQQTIQQEIATYQQ